ncbi:hypothetical protein [Maridesulfovibrio sp. FT414]|uniref:hypothetical protein n=1 Tax=Maridesulfovibrio sp. FT414 TaxID=2979469 RepID=UPI003D803264
MKVRRSVFISLLLWAMLAAFMSGCIWGTAAIVGVAVVGANVEEFRESGKPRNATQDLEEHLEDRRKVDEAIANSALKSPERIDTDEIIETYGSPIQDN